MGNETNPINNNFQIGRRNLFEERDNRLNLNQLRQENIFVDSQRDRFLGGDILQFRLNRDFQPPPPVVPAPDPQKVADAVAAIKDSLDQGFTDWDVTHGDLRDIQDQFKNLNAEEANAVFAGLSDDDLKNWNQELNGLNGAYTFEERKQLFGELAGKLDGANLLRMTNAMSNENDIQALAHAVGQNASPQAKVDFVNGLMSRVETDHDSALAVAEVLGGMKASPAELQQILSNMRPTQLSAVMKAAYDEKSYYSHAGVSTSLDTKPLAALIDAVSAISDPRIKAEVFQQGALNMKHIQEVGGFFNPTIGDDFSIVRDALTALLNSDTTGIMTNLEENYRNGNGITAYVKSMLEDGKTAELGQIISRLCEGNNHNENRLARFTAESNGPDGRFKQNAQVLGYFSGALLAAAKQITSDTKAQGDMIKNIFGTIAGAGGATGPVQGVALAVLNGLTVATVDGVVDKINNGTLSTAEGLSQLIFPLDPATGRPYNGGTETDYDAAVGRVIDHNP